MDAPRGIIGVGTLSQRNIKYPSPPARTAIWYDFINAKLYGCDENMAWVEIGGGGEGTVTSVGLSLPSIFSVAGSPITDSGTLSATLENQAGNTVFAAPDGIAGAPSFRSLASNDIPSITLSKISDAGDLASQDTVDLMTDVTGALPIANGGTGGSSAADARTNLGLGAIAVQDEIDLTSDVLGVLPIANGGTGATTAEDARTNLGITESSGIPPGAIMPYAGSLIPSGWLICDGSEVSRSTYSNLFDAILTIYGGGDGSTTFNLPDLRGRVIAAFDSQGAAGSANRISTFQADVFGGTTGSESHTLTESEIPSHTHGPNNAVYFASRTLGGGSSQYATTSGTYILRFESRTAATGGGESHPNIQPTMFMYYIIKT